MPAIEGSRVTPRAVFTPEYWGDYEAVNRPAYSQSPVPTLARKTLTALFSNTVQTALASVEGYTLPEGAVVDLNNPDEKGAQNLAASVLLIDREALSPHVSTTDPNVSELPAPFGSNLTC